MLTLLLTIAMFAQKQYASKQSAASLANTAATTVAKSQSTPVVQKIKTCGTKSADARKAPRKIVQTDLVTPPAEASIYPCTASGTFTDGTYSLLPDMNISVAIAGDEIYLQGLAYYFPEGWIKGVISGNQAIFDAGFVGSDSYGDEYIFGSDDAETLSEEIIFAYDAENQTLTQTTSYILENGGDLEFSPWCYGYGIKLAWETIATPKDLAIDNVSAHQATVSWSCEADSYNLRYRKAADKVLFESFEDGIPADWKLVNTDGDNYNWTVADLTTAFSGNYSAYDGTKVLYSRSWVTNALTPDQWIISPKIDLGGVLKYWIMDDGSYKETYAIYVSTDGTDISNFEDISGELQSPGSKEWTPMSFDLSDYAGQQGYIAFRHYNCTDQDFMFIDAITVTAGEAGEWIEVNGISDTSYTIENLEQETEYEVEVQAVYGEESSKWVGTSFTTPNEEVIPSNIAISDFDATSATVTWEGGQAAYNLRYREPAKKNGFFEDFENGIPEGWTLIDADGDGYEWSVFKATDVDAKGNPVCFDNVCATSASYNSSGALTPDNWLISPKLELKGEFSVWARGQDPSWAAEHFAVYISTGGTDIADFEELIGETEATGLLTEYKADLSAYEGQEGYIAIRHFNCTDMFRLNIDNFFVKYGEDLPAGEWIEVNNVTSPYTINGLEPQTKYEVQVQGILNEGTTEWSESVLFTTDVVKYTLEEALEAGEPCTIEDIVALVANDGTYCYVTDGGGNWARLKGFPVLYFDPTWALDLVGTFAIEDGIPTITLASTDDIAGTLDIEPIEPDVLDLTHHFDAESAPKASQVMTVTGYYYNGRLYAYSGLNGTPGLGVPVEAADGSEFESGTQYNVTAVIQLLEPWENAADGAPRNIKASDFSAFDNIKAIVVDKEAGDPVLTGIDDIKATDGKKDVQYFDLLGRPVGKSLENVPAGLYIGNDGTKVRK